MPPKPPIMQKTGAKALQASEVAKKPSFPKNNDKRRDDKNIIIPSVKLPSK